MNNALYEVTAEWQRERPVYIYVLVDPRTDSVFYVGCTKNPRARLMSHIAEIKYPTSKSPKHETIRSLVAKGLSPRMFVMEETSEAEATEAEAMWMAHFGIECNYFGNRKAPKR